MTPAILYVPLLGLLDRLSGSRSGNGTFKRLIVYTLTIGSLSYFAVKLGVLASVLMGICFLISRDPKWTIFGGDSHPRRNQIAGTFARHSLALAFLFPLALTEASFPISLALLVGYAAIATFLGLLNREKADKGKDINVYVESIRGATLGLAIFLALQTVN